jgi:hypothetical protein
MGTILYSWNSIPKAVPVSARDAYYHTRDVNKVLPVVYSNLLYDHTDPIQWNQHQPSEWQPKFLP